MNMISAFQEPHLGDKVRQMPFPRIEHSQPVGKTTILPVDLKEDSPFQCVPKATEDNGTIRIKRKYARKCCRRGCAGNCQTHSALHDDLHEE